MNLFSSSGKENGISRCSSPLKCAETAITSTTKWWLTATGLLTRTWTWTFVSYFLHTLRLDSNCFSVSHFAPRYISMHFQYFDMNRDGRLNPEEFRRAWAGFFSTVGSTIVDMFDRDHNGKLWLFFVFLFSRPDMIDSYEMHDFQYYMNYFYPSSFQHSQMSRFFNNNMYSFSKWDMTEFALQNTNRWW